MSKLKPFSRNINSERLIETCFERQSCSRHIERHVKDNKEFPGLTGGSLSGGCKDFPFSVRFTKKCKSYEKRRFSKLLKSLATIVIGNLVVNSCGPGLLLGCLWKKKFEDDKRSTLSGGVVIFVARPH